MVLSFTHRADNFMFRFDGLRGGVLAARNTLSSFHDLKFPGSQTSLKIVADLSMGDLTHATAEPVADQRTLIHNRLTLKVLVASKGQRFSNAVKNVDWPLLMLRPFTRRSYNGVRLVSKVCSQLSVCGHHLARWLNFLTVTGRVRSDLGSFFPRAARAFEVFTNLLASGTGCVEIFLCVSLDLRSTAPPCRNFVTELSEAVSQLGLIDRRGKLLGGEKALRLDCARLAVVALGDVENDRVSMQLWRDIPIDRTRCIVLKLGGYKFASRLGRMIAADAGLRVVFELVEGHADAFPVGFTDTLIAADEGGQRHGFGS